MNIAQFVRDLEKFIETNPNRCSGKPVLRGTRFSIAQVFAEIADGRSVKELADDLSLDEDKIIGMLHVFAYYLERTSLYDFVESLQADFDHDRHTDDGCSLNVDKV